jgi:hypothetical protein
MENFNIAVFGCWNEGFKKNSGQSSVYEVLKKNEEKYEFLVILGDNYYADKKKTHDNKIKISMTDLDEAKRGFKYLNDINLEKKIIFGNHDIKNSLNKGCSVLKSQLKLPWYDVKFPYSYDLYYLLKENNYFETILMIYLDTTLYDKDIKEDSCYYKTLGKNHKKLKIEQENFIKNTLAIINNNPIYNIKNVIFYGHEPLLTYKEKEKKGQKIQKESVLEDLLNILFEQKKIYVNTNFYWICADYHIYQNGKITDRTTNLTINQWIFGTGGGELDDTVSSKDYEYNNYILEILNNIVYDSNDNNISKEYDKQLGVNQFGYGEITFNSSSVTHKFIRSDYVKMNDHNGGSLVNYNKYLKYKSKYLKLKI